MPIDTHVPVVLFNADTHAALGVLRSLGRLGVPVYCIDRNPRALPLKSRYCSGRFIWDYERHSSEALVDYLIHVAAVVSGKPVLLPMFDLWNNFADDYRTVLAAHYRVTAPRSGAIARLYSKRGLYELCISEGVPTADSYFPTTLQDACQAAQRLGFPVAIKAIDPNRLLRRTGRRLAVARDDAQLVSIYQEFDEPGHSNLFLQRYISGEQKKEWICSSYFDRDARCRFAISAIKLRQVPISGGNTAHAVTAPCEPLAERIRRIAQAAGYHGVLDADFCFDPQDGQYKLLDLNPRLGANFRVGVDRHGLDAVRCWYLDLTGQQIPDVRPEWGRTWVAEDTDYWACGELMRVGRLRLHELLASWRGASEFAWWASDDLRPSLAFATTLAKLVAVTATRRIRRQGTARQ